MCVCDLWILGLLPGGRGSCFPDSSSSSSSLTFCYLETHWGINHLSFTYLSSVLSWILPQRKEKKIHLHIWWGGGGLVSVQWAASMSRKKVLFREGNDELYSSSSRKASSSSLQLLNVSSFTLCWARIPYQTTFIPQNWSAHFSDVYEPLFKKKKERKSWDSGNLSKTCCFHQGENEFWCLLRFYIQSLSSV